MKRWKGIFLAFLLVLTQIPAAQAVGTSASSAILMEAASGRVLYEHNADEPRLIASITKLMTALVALESGKSLDDVVTIQAEDTRTEGSALYLKPGEHVKLETLLYGLLLHSGNDAALAIARFCGGSVEDFVAGMNAKAQELGMTNSHFANPNGLNDEGHYSSAGTWPFWPEPVWTTSIWPRWCPPGPSPWRGAPSPTTTSCYGGTRDVWG